MDPEEEPEHEEPFFGEDDEDVQEPPASFWDSLSEITGGLLALFLVAAAVLVLYVIGGVFLGLMTRAAPAILTIAAAIILGRYLSRTR